MTLGAEKVPWTLGASDILTALPRCGSEKPNMLGFRGIKSTSGHLEMIMEKGFAEYPGLIKCQGRGPSRLDLLSWRRVPKQPRENSRSEYYPLL